MGLLVIQDMPAMVDGDRKPDAAQQAEFERQYEIMIEQHKSYPSIYTWVRSSRRDSNESFCDPSSPFNYTSPLTVDSLPFAF